MANILDDIEPHEAQYAKTMLGGMLSSPECPWVHWREVELIDGRWVVTQIWWNA